MSIARRVGWFLPKSLLRGRTKPNQTGRLRLESLEDRRTPTGIYTGTVFQDFNFNGTRDLTSTIPNFSGVGAIGVAVDRGLAGVTVRAFDSAGTPQGTTTTIADGSFSFTPTGTGPYRFEFVPLPAGFFPGPDGVDSHSTVQFANDGGAAALNLGLVLPSDYSENNPLLITNRFTFGDQQTEFPTDGVIVSFPYSSGGLVHPDDELPGAPHEIEIPSNRVGTTWGLGWDALARDLYASAYFKRHAGFGPDGTGAVYRVPVPSPLPAAPYQPPAGSLLYADLNAIFGAGTAGANLHDTVDNNGNGLTDDYDRDNDNIGWDAVGKSSLGGLDVSDDGQFIFAMNLFDRQLYRIPTSGTLDATTVQRVSIPLTNPDATVIAPAGFNAADLRPFAVEYYRGQLYVGVVYSAETSADRNELLAAVYAVDPATLTFNATPILTARLNYTRSQSTIGFAEPALGSNWEAWRTTYFSTATGATRGVAPQPMFTGIAFDPDGNMVMGIRDRGADQIGYFNLSNPANSTRIEGFTAGDTLRAFVNTPNDLSAGWALENNARGPAGQGTGPQGNNSGPGGGEFYFQENFGTSHGETSMGGVLQLPGFPNVVSTNMDPAVDFRTGGVSWFNNQSGGETKALELYQNTNNPPPFEPTFSKANGLGDLVALTTASPLEIGDRVWLDTNANGVQDSGEAGIAGVTVELLNAVGAVIGTATTDAGGNYVFSSAAGTSTASKILGINQLLPGASFSIRVPSAVGGSQQGALAGLLVTLTDANSGTDSDLRDSDGSLGGNDAVVTITTAGPGSNNHTYDFGFASPEDFGDAPDVTGGPAGGNPYPTLLEHNGPSHSITGLSLGATVDAEADGQPDATATGDGADEDGVVFTPLFAGQTATFGVTASGPALLNAFIDFNGDGDFADAGEQVTSVAGQLLAAGNNNLTFTVPVGATAGTTFARFRLSTAGGLSFDGPAADGEVEDYQLTIQAVASLGDFVWEDLNANGVQDAGEPGIDGVTVNLLGSGPDGAFGTGDDTNATTTTAGGGLYQFTGLAAGTYQVTFVAAVGFTISPQDQGGNDATDSDADPATGQTATITLALGQNDPNWDAGMFRLTSLGDFVWEDLNANGVQDPLETGINGIAVQLVGPGPDATLGTGDDVVLAAAATADSGGGVPGFYQFTGLTPGNYRVRFGSVAGATTYTRTIRDAGADDTTDSDADPATGETGDIALAASLDTTIDAGLYLPVSLGDRVWFDPDGDGVQDAGEPGIPNATVTVTWLGPDGVAGGGDDVVSTTATLADGIWTVTNIPPGNYTVAISNLPVGLSTPTYDLDSGTTTPDDTTAVTAPSGSNRTDVDFGYRGLGSLGDRVWDDANGNQIQDPTETGLNGVTVQLTWAGLDGDLSTAADNYVASMVTATDGNYLFGNLPAGPYRVDVLSGVPAGYSPTFDLDGIATANTATTTLTDAQNRTDVDFGFANFASFAGFVYEDANNDGIKDPLELPIPGVTIALTGTDSGGNPVTLTTLTLADGSYLFGNLQPGTYTVTETQPAGFVDGTDTVGTPALTGIVAANDSFATFQISAGTAAVNYNFGERHRPVGGAASIRGNVYFDMNNDGLKGPGEQGIGGVTVRLTGTDDLGRTIRKNVVTDAQGRYAFIQMRPGTYTLTELHPAAYADGRDRAGSLGGTAANDVIRQIIMAGGQNGVDYNFGERGLATGFLSKRLLINVPSGNPLAKPGSGVTIVDPLLGP